MEWVAELRAFLVKDELKYKFFVPERHRVQANHRLYRRMMAGIERAEITIIDPFEYEYSVSSQLAEMGAEYGGDFDDRIVHEMASDALLEDSPLRAAQISHYDWLNDTLKTEQSGDFSTDSLRRRIGGKRRDAVVTAARAHAMISPSEKSELIAMFSGFAMPNLSERVSLIRKMARIFDVEHAKSLPVLNEFSERIAHAAQLPYLLELSGFGKTVQEERSENVDHIQGADMAAGLAVDVLTLNGGDVRALARQFAWVAVNGVVIPG
jgi:hypothetical protein